MLNSPGDCLGFVRLCFGQQLDCIAIREPRFETAVHCQHEDNQPDEGNNVSAEEASWTEPIPARHPTQRSPVRAGSVSTGFTLKPSRSELPAFATTKSP